MAPKPVAQSPGVDHGVSDGVSTRSSKRKLSESNDTDDESDGTPSKKQRSEIPTIKVEASNESDDEAAQPEPEPEPAKRGSRGGGRPRGRGRGRGGRGGRGGAANSARGTPSRDLLLPPVRGGRGRGGGRVKKSDNARIQALYHRKKDLKGQFKQVAAIQKEALSELALKSLESAEDLEYLRALPEFKEVTSGLLERYRKVTAQNQARMKNDVAFANRQLKNNFIYTSRGFKCKIAEILDRYEAQIKQDALYIERQAKTGGNDEDTPYYRGVPGEVVKEINRPRSIVHPIATPYYPGFVEIDTDPYQGIVHPAEWWHNMLDDEGRKAWREADRKRKPIDEPVAADGDELARKKPGRKSKNASPMKGKGESEPAVARMKSSLYQPALHGSLGQQNDASVAATPAELSETELDQDQVPTPDGNEEAMDKFGTYLPKKPIPRNGEPPQNRFVQKPHMTFDDDDIGVRVHHTKKVQKEQLYLGSDPNPNPAHLHYDQFARGENSALNSPDDLDPDLVETYRVHPTYGIPVPGCRNPDVPTKTDWTKDLEPTNPIVFVEKETGKAHHTSRSAWMIEAMRKWETTDLDEATRDKVRTLLEMLTPPEAREEEEPQDEGVIHPALLDAVNNAPVITPAAPVASPPRRQFYDAARDTTSSLPYQTPYTQPRKKPGQSLVALAEAAEHAGRQRPTLRQLSGYSMGPLQWQPPPPPPAQSQPQPQAQYQAQYQPPLRPQPQYQPPYPPPPPQYPPQPQYAPPPPRFPGPMSSAQPPMPGAFYHPPPLQPQPQPAQQPPRGLRPLAPAPPLPPPTQWSRFRHS